MGELIKLMRPWRYFLPHELEKISLWAEEIEVRTNELMLFEPYCLMDEEDLDEQWNRTFHELMDRKLKKEGLRTQSWQAKITQSKK